MPKTLSSHGGLLYVSCFSSDGEILDVTLEDSKAHQSYKGILWTHMCALHADSKDWLTEQTDLDELVINAMLAEETRPRILVRKEGVMIILRAMNLHEDENPEDMISLRLWIDKKRIITARRRDIMSIEDIKSCIEANNPPKTSGEFLTMITDRVYTRMEPFIEDLEDRVAATEEIFAKNKGYTKWDDAGLIRTRIAIFRRYVMPQKTVLEGLIKAKYDWLSEEDIEHLVESHDRVTRYIELLNDVKDRTQILIDEINRHQDAKLNTTSYLFSVAATIFLPLGFLTGLMGINIGGMPGVNDSSAFWLFTGICAVLVVFQVALFKKLNWF